MKAHAFNTASHVEVDVNISAHVLNEVSHVELGLQTPTPLVRFLMSS